MGSMREFFGEFSFRSSPFPKGRGRIILRLMALRMVCVLGLFSFLLAFPQSNVAEALWKVGTAKVIIILTQLLWLAGYGRRERPAEGKVTELWIRFWRSKMRGGSKPSSS